MLQWVYTARKNLLFEMFKKKIFLPAGWKFKEKFFAKKILFSLQVVNPKSFFFPPFDWYSEKRFLKQYQSNRSTNHGEWGVVLQTPKQMCLDGHQLIH